MNDGRPLSLDFKMTDIAAMRFVVNYFHSMSGLNLTPTQCEVFIVLKENGDSMSQRDMEKCLDLSKSTLSGIIGTMERRGFVEKTVSEEDKRVMIISLTEEGNRVYSDALSILHQVDRILLSGLDDEEIATLGRVLDRMRRNATSNDVE